MFNSKKTALILRSTDIYPEPRVERAIKDLKEADYDVKKFYWKRTKSTSYELNEPNNKNFLNFPAPYGAGLRNIFGQFIWQIWLLIKIITTEYDLLYACDADTALIASLTKKFKKFKLVYDQFDQISSRFKTRIIDSFSNSIDSFISKHSDLVIIASKDREFATKTNILLVSNNPEIKPLNVKPNKNLILKIAYCGVLQNDRGLEELINVASKSPEIEITIAGFGPLEKFIREKANGNIKFVGRIDFEQVFDLYSQSDVAYAVYDPDKSNNKNSASSKLFEALISGVPCIVAKDSNLEPLIRKYQIGWSIEYGNSGDLLSLVDTLKMKNEQLIPNFEANRDNFIRDFDSKKQHTNLVRYLSELCKEV